MLVLILILASLASWAQIPVGGGGGTGDVGGAPNLTTVGAIPYVSAAGVLNQDAGLSWDAANDRATFGSGVGRVQVGTIVAGVPFPGLWLGDFTPAVTNYVLLADAGSGVALNAPTTSQWISFRAGNTDRMRLTATTGNLLVGTTTDSNFKLDVAASGSAGTMRVYDATATTGTTRMVVRAGAGQSTSRPFEYQNSSGVFLSGLRADGSFEASSFFGALVDAADRFAIGASTSFNNSYLVQWSSTGAYNGAKDLSLSRASAGVLQVGDGGSNANGEIQAKIHTWINGTEATCNSTTRGEVVMVQGGAGVADTLRVCRKDAADAYAWTALY